MVRQISLYRIISDMDERLSDWYTKEELTIKWQLFLYVGSPIEQLNK